MKFEDILVGDRFSDGDETMDILKKYKRTMHVYIIEKNRFSYRSIISDIRWEQLYTLYRKMNSPRDDQELMALKEMASDFANDVMNKTLQVSRLLKK